MHVQDVAGVPGFDRCNSLPGKPTTRTSTGPIPRSMDGPFVPDVIGGTAPPAAMRPVLSWHGRRQDRVGEHNAVVCQRLSQTSLGDPVDVRGVDYPAATAQRPEPDIVQHDVQPHSGVPAGAFGGTYRAQSGTNSRISRFTTPRDGSATAQPILSGRRPRVKLGRGAGYPSRSMCSS